MKSRNFIMVMMTLCVIFVVGCSSELPPAGAPTELQDATLTQAPSPNQFESIDIPNARSVSIAGNSAGDLYVAYGIDHSLYVSRSTDAGLTFSAPVLATSDSQVHVLSVERPAIAVDNEGRVGVAWLELPADFQGADIWYATSHDGGQTFAAPVRAWTESSGEVAMVQVALDSDGNPYLAWLNGSKLKFTHSEDGGRTFSEAVRVGGGSCECCQPQVLVAEEDVYIAYRGVEASDTRGDIRDILMIRSVDGGANFGSPTRASDTHWYLPACPIAGPSVAMREDNLFIAFMDGRFEPAGTFSRGDVWFAALNDNDSTFSPNVRINPDQNSHHTLPSIAVGPGGRIHIAWESLSQGEGGNNLYYTFSDDSGQSFAPPQIVADNSDDSLGNPGKAMIVVDPEGSITLAWLDRSGAHIASWMDPR
jgi:hypothetical protein